MGYRAAGGGLSRYRSSRITSVCIPPAPPVVHHAIVESGIAM